ncbi:MAG: molybdopterin-binding protein [Thermoguttaceae bacterium]|nr:molybdopterin-binding protein [Thermoguttaceae bacterium]
MTTRTQSRATGRMSALQATGWWVCAFLVAFGPPARADEPPARASETADYAIVVTGTELLAGAYADAHTAFLTKTLHPRGLRCVMAIIVGDSMEEIQKAVRIGLDHAPLVIVTGGLGPTEDDVTRQAISELTGIRLREHPDLLAAMARRFNVPVDQLRANLRRQTEIPVRGGYLENGQGSAAGLIFEADQRLVVALPGPPRELQPMVEEKLVPYLAAKFGTRAVGGLLKVRFVGIGESAISDTLDRLVPIPDDVTVGSLFEGMRVDFYFSLPGAAPEDLECLDRLNKQILTHLGEFVYATGNTSLEAHVVELFAGRKQTLALAEVGSGGSLAAGLSSSDAVAGVLAGAYVAPDEEQLCRLLGMPEPQDTSDDADAAKQLAGRLAELTKADWAVWVGAVRDDDARGRYVEVLLRQPDGGVESLRLNVRGTGDLARFHLTTQLLDLLRRHLRP